MRAIVLSIASAAAVAVNPQFQHPHSLERRQGPCLGGSYDSCVSFCCQFGYECPCSATGNCDADCYCGVFCDDNGGGDDPGDDDGPGDE
ncbi:hypothetical protein SAPIO_CDS6841 [Scedosporium apiospermum]|uniref:Uncharacterized protein n=1 Tax=Pseudallescheria apiosperma TaxID=563466 RepID=A0A084G2W7_PSEDA|nr:uncharacterized protein SAPIO_CDS6841 [Scedosporium apiospermum]KEZ41679.1 hypothetical protein SAPIO_CDS6841 [Scedosporium apiospermum]